MTGALEGIRVIDAATFLAAPFCGTIMADFGAEVIKVEQPGSGDSLRGFGSRSSAGDTFMWMSEARNKASVTLDLRTPEGADLLRDLVGKSDVLLENFRPGTLEKWGLGYEELSRINPRLVMLRVSAYGQTGPYRNKPGFARIAHAFGGLAYLAGEPGRPPVVPGSTSLADYISGLFGAIGVLIALRHVDRTGKGQIIDIALYESIFRLLDELAPAYAANDVQRERMGPDVINITPHSHYPTADGHWVALACSNDRMWERLCRAMQKPELATDTRFATMPQRDAHRHEVNAMVTEWTLSHACVPLLAICDAEEVPASKLLSISDIFQDPQFAARENLVEIEDPRVGRLTLPSPLPKMSRTPPSLRHAGPALGDSNDRIFRDLLGLSAERLFELKQAGVI